MTLHFASKCGENIAVKNDEAEWRSFYSGGACFSEQPIGKDPLQISISGSGHVIVGYIGNSPRHICVRNALNEMSKINDVRVHKSTFKISMRLSSGGRELVIDSDNNQVERFPISKGGVWISFYIKFGSAVITLESKNDKLSTCCGENIILSNNHSTANLIEENPAAICFVDKSLFCGDALKLKVSPIIDPKKSKTCCLPSRYYIKIGVYQDKSELIENKHPSSFKVLLQREHYNWKPLHILEKHKCQGTIQIALSTSGQFVFSSESGTTGSVQVPNLDCQTGTICVFELFRVRLQLLQITKLPTYDYPSIKHLSDPAEDSESTIITENNSLSETGFKNAYISSNSDCSDDSTSIKRIVECRGNKQETKATNILSEETRPKVPENSSIEKAIDKDSDEYFPEIKITTMPIDQALRVDQSLSFNTQSSLDLDEDLLNTRDDNLTCSMSLLASDGRVQNSPTEVHFMNIPVFDIDDGHKGTLNNNKCTDHKNRTLCNNVGATEEVLRRENLELRERIMKLEEQNKILQTENEKLQNICCTAGNRNSQPFNGENPKTPTSPNNRLSVLIQTNFVQFVNDLEIPDLCDHLYQHCQITWQDLDDLHQLVKQNKREANRHFLTLIRKRAIQYDVLVSALLATKQEGLVQLL